MQATCKLVLCSQFRLGINRCIATTAPDYLNIHTDGAVEKTVAYRKEQYAKLYKKGEALATDVTEKAIQLQIPTTTHDASILTGVPEEHVVSRRVRIYRPTKNAMQSGAQNSKLWKIEFDTRERWENPTMGWTSNADPLSNVSVAMSFKTKEDAIAFTERQGWTCFVDEAREKKMQPKSYAINFAWNKRTRRAMK